jgi:polyhydroxybutyrate depolymerase
MHHSLDDFSTRARECGLEARSRQHEESSAHGQLHHSTSLAGERGIVHQRTGALMRKLALVGAGLGVALVVFAAWGLRFRRAPEPALPGALVAGSLEHGGRTRTWHAYLPARRVAAPALVFVLHGSGGDGAQARSGYAFAFDELAESEGFIAVYPDGFEAHWNDCRKAGPYAANSLDVDDVGFLRVLARRFADEYGADPTRVFATGISNGGQLALRLALEAPDLVRAVAPVAASLPAASNLDCKPAGRPVSVLIMNGTADPMNPFGGGDVALYGLVGNRGAVLSSADSIDYFRELAGYEGAGEHETLPDRDPRDGSRVEVDLWRAPARKAVAHFVIENGGHNAPSPALEIPRFFGPTNHDISAAHEIWRFFAEAP